MPNLVEKLIIWDGYGLENPYSGIAFHAHQLHHSLQKIGIYPLVTTATAGNTEDFTKLYCRSSWLPAKFQSTKLFHSLSRIPSFVEKSFPDSSSNLVMHGLSNFNIPVLSSSKQKPYSKVVTVHDLIPLIEKRSVSRSLYWQMKIMMGRVLRESEKIVCVSDWTMRSIEDLFPGLSSKISIIPNGYRFYSSSQSRENVPRGTGIRMISVGRHERYKRIEFMLEILKAAPEYVSLDLVSGVKSMELAKKKFPELIDSKRLRLYHSISSEKLDDLYLEADLLIHTSLVEGFCLPASEMIARGKPVLFTTGSGIDEVVGPCGFGLDKNATIKAWAEAIVEGAWKTRPETIENWISHQKTWDDVAHEWSKIYASL